MTTRTFTGLAATRRGQTQQINKTFHGMAEDMKHRRAVASADCDQPTTLPAALMVIESLQQQLADAQTLIDDMRAQANSDAPISVEVNSTLKYWDSKRVARESNVAVCTICRNAQSLGGTKLGGDWLFPVGTTYGIKRHRK